MDNEMIKRLYDRGIRAYVSDRGIYFDEPPIDPDDPNDGGATPFAWAYKDGEAMWHSLRAYQNEQRKKGEPIVLSHHGIVRWYNNDYSSNGNTFAFDEVDSRPMIAVIDQYSSAGLARFTNFRWRPRHPRCSQGICLLNRCIDGSWCHPKDTTGHGPKGGDHGIN